ncbi:hypothetical protein [Nonlabens ulvanivorans]|nr:hypothetical protein [Nonlabens ulvanivorans]
MAIALMAMLSITSCEKDDTPLETIQEQPQFKIEKLTGSQLTNNHSLNKALSGAKESLGINTFQKSVYDSINGFYIEDTDVNYLSSGTYESYTFKITDPSDTTHLKNMVFSKQMDSTYQAFIVAYDLNYITLDDIRQGSIPVDATPYVRYTPVTSSFQHKNGVVMIGEGDCVSFAEVSPARNCTVGDHAPGEACDLDEGDWRRAQEATLVFYMEPCGGGDLLPSNGDVNPGGDFPNDPGPPTGGQTNPGGSGQLPLINNNTNEPDEPCNDQLTLSNGDCAGVITSPVIDLKPAPTSVADETQEFFDRLEQTDEELWRFINDSDQDDLRNDTDNFLVDENHSDEAKNFAEEAIKAKEEDEDNEVDFENKSIYDVSVPDCLKDIIDKFKPTNNFYMDMNGVAPSLQQQLNIATQTLSLFDNTGNYGITFAVSNIPVNAQTNPTIINSNGTDVLKIKIEFSAEYISRATDLALARSVVHELVHAYLYYINQTNPNSVLGQKLDEIIDDLTSISTQHQIMSDQFAGAIATAIEAWDNSNHQHEEYDYLSWSGDMTASTDFLLLNQNFIENVFERAYAEEGVLSLNPTIQNILPIGDRNCN